MHKKVLIVEDEFIVANNLRLILTKAGYKVACIAASAEEAEKHLEKHKPDLIILDIRLDGERSGIDFARKLKAENIAFIYLSANSSPEILDEATLTEPYGFLIKPFREKDLLVMLDIAWYRHQHGIESKLRQEELLQAKLAEINNQTGDEKEKLLQFVKAMQAHIPFDFMALALRPLSDTQFRDIGYLRIGFDEYQFIGEKELKVVTGVKEHVFSAIVKNMLTKTSPMAAHNAAIQQTASSSILQTFLFEAFNLKSYMEFPVHLNNGLSVHYFFYSRQLNIYNEDHIALLNRLKTSLADAAQKIIYHETLSASARNHTANKTKEISNHPAFKNIIGSHHLLLSALDLAAQVAPYNTSVLILGETGTGKEKIAHAIHTFSSRKNGPYVKINCAAIPPALIESELFGHEKGAFTGAIEKRKGRFEQAHGGTIFLDEIGELPLDMQVKLLRVLQEKEIEYVGGNSFIKIDIRIVAATNRNLEKEVAAGKFRLDLYYRLNVFPVMLPPLRERKTDIEALALFFAKRFCQEFNKPFSGISDVMMEELMHYDWPGNIRELENVLEQAVVLNDGASKLELKRKLTGIADEPVDNINIKTYEDVRYIQKQTEKDYIISMLKKSNGRIRGAHGAAELLNIKPTTLESKIAKLNIRKKDF